MRVRTAAPATPTPRLGTPAGQAACRGRSPRPSPGRRQELATGPPSCRDTEQALPSEKVGFLRPRALPCNDG